MTISTYRRISLGTAALAGVGASGAHFFILFTRNGWPYTILLVIGTILGLGVSAWALHRALYPHDSPAPRYRLPRSHRA